MFIQSHVWTVNGTIDFLGMLSYSMVVDVKNCLLESGPVFKFQFIFVQVAYGVAEQNDDVGGKGPGCHLLVCSQSWQIVSF